MEKLPVEVDNQKLVGFVVKHLGIVISCELGDMTLMHLNDILDGRASLNCGEEMKLRMAYAILQVRQKYGDLEDSKLWFQCMISSGLTPAEIISNFHYYNYA